MLSEEGIRLELDDRCRKFPIKVYKTIDSTNVEAKRIALENGVNGMIVLAEEQTKGKGRLGRSFYSPANNGFT